MQPEQLDQIPRALVSTARLFRLGMLAQASDALVALVDGMCGLLTDAAFTDATVIGPVLHDVVQAQERGDAIRIADLLEYELLPLVCKRIPLRNAS